MSTWHIRSMVCTLALSAVFTAVGTIEAVAQQATLPEGWANLGAAEFIAATKPIYDQGKFESLSRADQEAVRARGKALFLEVDIANTSLSYETIAALHWLAKSSLEGPIVERTRNALLARQDEWADKPYAEIRAKFILMQQSGIPLDVTIAEAKRWVQAGGTIEQVPQEERAAVRSIFANPKLIERGFTVQWEGSVNPPETGNYTFSISPINANSADPQLPLKLTMTVSVEGQEVLNATPENWVSQSSPVSMTAGDPKLVVVSFQAEARELPNGALNALLYWQGPGVPKAIVPASRVRVPGTGNPGFQATYAWTDRAGQPQMLTRIDREIDFAWTTTSILLEQDPTGPRQVAENVWNEVSTDEFFAWCETSGPTVKWHPYLKRIWESPASLTSAQRNQFLTKMLANPAQLNLLGPKDAVFLFQGFRFGAEDKALEAFQKWALDRADVESGISNHPAFEIDSREAYRRMAILVTRELPEAATRLQNESLETPNGRCCLPVAYTLAYSYLGKGQLDQWIALLAARLEGNGVAGDKRVNWLMARAHAEEIRLSEPNLYLISTSRPVDGRGYLDEGLIVAETPAVKARIAKEIAARLASTQQFAKAKEVVEQVMASLPEGERASLSSVLQQLEASETLQVESQQARTTAAQQSYVENLRKRRDRAATAGDTEAVGRYEALINAAGGE